MRLENGSTFNAPLKSLNGFFWTWYWEHKDDTYPVPIRILGISTAISVEMEKLEGLFAVIFGPNPRTYA